MPRPESYFAALPYPVVLELDDDPTILKQLWEVRQLQRSLAATHTEEGMLKLTRAVIHFIKYTDFWRNGRVSAPGVNRLTVCGIHFDRPGWSEEQILLPTEVAPWDIEDVEARFQYTSNVCANLYYESPTPPLPQTPSVD